MAQGNQLNRNSQSEGKTQAGLNGVPPHTGESVQEPQPTGTQPTVRAPRRILGTLLSALSAGVVPRSGAPYIAIGRVEEIEALVSSLDRVAEGEGAIKFLIGRYGSGKSFLIQLSRGYAMDRGFVTADCDLSPERKLTGTGGQGLATYRELMKNLATKASPDGGALPGILGRWFASIRNRLTDEGLEPDSTAFREAFARQITQTVRALEFDVGGFDFAAVLRTYYTACEAEDDALQSACLRWLRGEYPNRTEARQAIGVKSLSIISDDNWYDYLKLMTAFVRLVGYAGLCVYIDECVNLFKITNRIARENNYEKILSMFNDTMQGRAPGMMLVFGGTPQFLEDTRRGLFSYEALRSRLSDGRYGGGELRSMMQPVIRLKRLSDSELLALVMRLTTLHGEYHRWTPRVTEEDMRDFLVSALSRTGADQMITPREIIRDYITILDLLVSNEGTRFSDIAGTIRTSVPPSGEADEPETAPVAPARTVTLDDLEF